MTLQDRASKAMWNNDNASAWVGMRLVSDDEEQAGLVLACKSRNQSTVAQHNMISFLVPIYRGDQ